MAHAGGSGPWPVASIWPRPFTARRPPPEATTSPAAAPAGRPASRRGKKGVLIYVDLETAKALKRLAIDRDTTLQALGVQALEALLEEASG